MTTAQNQFNEEERLKSLYELDILDTESDEEYDDVSRLAAYICDTPIAAISLVDKHRQWFKSTVGLDFSETHRDISFCAHTILNSNLTIVTDAATDVRFSQNPLVTADPHIRFYAGMPLLSPDGFPIGALCVLDTVARELTIDQQTALRVLARKVSNTLERTKQAKQNAELVVALNQAKATALQEQRRFQHLVEGLGTGLLVTDKNDIIEYANPKMADMTGYPQEDLKGMNAFELLLNSEVLEEVVKKSHERIDLPALSYDIEIKRKDGTPRWLEVHAVPYTNESNEIVGMLATNTDVTDRVFAEKAHRESERRLRLALEGGRLGWWHLDVVTGTYPEFSSQCKAHFGLSPEAQFGFKEFERWIHPDDRSRVDATIRTAIEGRTLYFCEFRIIWPDGSTHWLSAHGTPNVDHQTGNLTFIGITQDITQRKLLERDRDVALKEAQERADRDPLTGLLNHRAFHKRFELEAARAIREGTKLAILMLDINNFKFFNDVYSHATGDDVLLMVAKALQSVCRPYDILGRFGGDEFVLLLTNVGNSSATDIQSRIMTGLNDISFRAHDEDIEIPISLSVGTSIFPVSSVHRLEALIEADERMRWSKSGGTAEAQVRTVRSLARAELKGFSMLDALVTAVDNKDRYTRKHSEDVMVYSLNIARELELEESVQRTIGVAALIHDLGKIGVPDFILRKPGILSTEEYEAMKQHPEMGAVIVAAIPGLEDTLDAVRHHHEHFNGTGYPHNLVGEKIPLIARVMAVADAFSAMTTDRPYRKGMEESRAISILENGAGTQWDPDCVAAFIRSQTS